MDKKNAKDEFLENIIGEKIIGAIITFGDNYDEDKSTMNLPLLYSEEEYEKFLYFLDRNYDSGYGGQELFGVILCENNVWFERGEYDGSEWWEKNYYPNLNELFGEKLALKYERNMKLKKISKK